MANYTLDKRIGEGGMAEVFRARATGDAGFQRVVAVKRLLPEFARVPAVQARFVDEARIQGRLRHPCIVDVTDFYEKDGRQHLVMEFVDGASVEQLAARGVGGQFLSLAVVARLVHETARALEHAHAEGVLHRDVSCCNVLVSKAGEVKLSDFGLADARDRVSSTEPGTIVGKEEYLSPARRAGERATPQDDLFALGIVLRRLLAATDPRRREGADFDDLARLAARLVAPTDRLPSASALVALLRPVPRASAEALADLLATIPPPAPPPAPRPKLTAAELLAATDRGARPPVLADTDPGSASDAPTHTDWRPHGRTFVVVGVLAALVAAALVFSR